MRRLLLFLIKYRSFLLFVILELLCGYLIVQNNKYQSAAYLNTSNRAIAGILNISTQVNNYFNLSQTNQLLAEEVASLRLLFDQRANVSGKASDFNSTAFDYVTAKIVNNSTRRLKNYLTINSGRVENIDKDLAVIGGGGIVGRIKYVGQNYSVVTSLLHTDLLISSKIKNKVNLCSVKWGGKDPLKVNLLFVPRNIFLVEGDTVFTSGFDGYFPEDIPIGIISGIIVKPESTFLEGEVTLVNDFATLSYVHVVRNINKPEIDSLQNLIEIDE